MNLRREELYYIANNQKIANKKKADYQGGLEKSRTDSATRSRDSYMKDPEKSCAQSCESYTKNQEKSCGESAAWSRESYKNDLEKSREDSAAWSREHRHRNWGAWGASSHPVLCYVLRSLQLSKIDI